MNQLKEYPEECIFLVDVLNELHEIKMHLCNERFLEGGVGLGILISKIDHKIGKLSPFENIRNDMLLKGHFRPTYVSKF